MKLIEIYNMYKNKNIPESLPKKVSIVDYKRDDNGNLEIDYDNIYISRQEVVTVSSFALLSWNWITELSKFLKCKKCLEVCCGLGALTYCLRKKNIDIIATDNYTSHFKHDEDKWIEDIENIDCVESVEKYGKEVDYIILSWANYSESQAYYTLLKMREVNKKCKMIWIGELEYGCCGDDKFFELAKFDYDTLDYINDIFTRYDGLYDGIYLVE